MNKGPMSRMQRVPVKCKNCGKVKYNVVYKDADTETPKPKEEPEKPKVEPKKPKEKEVVFQKHASTHYIEGVFANQERIARNCIE